MKTFVDGQILKAADLNNAFTEIKQEAFKEAVTDHENGIYVGGTWYKRTGVYSPGAQGNAKVRSGSLYTGVFEIPAGSISIPPGYNVSYSIIDAGDGYAFCMTDAHNPRKCWFASTVQGQINKFAWILIKEN